MILLPPGELGLHLCDQGLVLGIETVLERSDLLVDTLLDLLSPVQPGEVTLGDARGSVALDQIELARDFADDRVRDFEQLVALTVVLHLLIVLGLADHLVQLVLE